jgi:DNA-binding transcriptional regulator YiaG
METLEMQDRIASIRQIKKNTGLSNEKIARGIGVTMNTVHRWLNVGDEPKSDAVKSNIDRFIGQYIKYLKK